MALKQQHVISWKQAQENTARDIKHALLLLQNFENNYGVADFAIDIYISIYIQLTPIE